MITYALIRSVEYILKIMDTHDILIVNYKMLNSFIIVI